MSKNKIDPETKRLAKFMQGYADNWSNGTDNWNPRKVETMIQATVEKIILRRIQLAIKNWNCNVAIESTPV